MTQNNQPLTAKKASKTIGFVFNSSWLVSNIYFFLFLSAIAVLYIANGHFSDKTARNIDKTKKELRDLQFEYKTVKAELMHKSEEAEVLKMAEPLGLTISAELPKRLQLQRTK
jgi:predicted lactoylglutathione lyase